MADWIERFTKNLPLHADHTTICMLIDTALRKARNEALEEAAQVASDEEIGVSPENLTEFSKGYLRACRDIAAAIRALKEKEDG